MKYYSTLFSVLALILTPLSSLQAKIIAGEHYYMRGKYHYPDESLKQKYISDVLLGQDIKEEVKLANIKYALVNGNLLKAKALIRRDKYNFKKLAAILLRYEAIIAFIEKDFNLAHEILSHKKLQDPIYKSNHCT